MGVDAEAGTETPAEVDREVLDALDAFESFADPVAFGVACLSEGFGMEELVRSVIEVVRCGTYSERLSGIQTLVRIRKQIADEHGVVVERTTTVEQEQNQQRLAAEQEAHRTKTTVATVHRAMRRLPIGAKKLPFIVADVDVREGSERGAVVGKCVESRRFVDGAEGAEGAGSAESSGSAEGAEGAEEG